MIANIGTYHRKTKSMAKAKLISTVRVKEAQAEELKEKAYELTVATKEVVKEADIVHWILEKEVKEVTVEEWVKSHP